MMHLFILYRLPDLESINNEILVKEERNLADPRNILAQKIWLPLQQYVNNVKVL